MGELQASESTASDLNGTGNFPAISADKQRRGWKMNKNSSNNNNSKNHRNNNGTTYITYNNDSNNHNKNSDHTNKK